jgi:hypothetical protein
MRVTYSDLSGHEVVTLLPLKAYDPLRVVVYHTGGGETAQVLDDLKNEKRSIFEALTEAGYIVTSVTSSGRHWGSPEALVAHDLLYKWVADEYGALKIAIWCQSMGGLSAYNWTCRNPQCVLGIYGIYPVTNLPSMMVGTLEDSIVDIYARYDIDIQNAMSEYDPIRQIGSCDVARIPVKHRHGDSDQLVKYRENALDFAQVYGDTGGRLDLITVRGLGHVADPVFFVPDEVVSFMDSLDWKSSVPVDG